MSARKSKLEEAADQILEETERPLSEEPKPDFSRVVSTGSTLLDLTISGGVLPEGGIPGGIMIEIFGAESTGKSALLLSIAASVQVQGGRGLIQDPEGRILSSYAKIYGVDLHAPGWEYKGPEEIGSVEEFFSSIRKWDPGPPGDFLDLIATDSLAALASAEELKEEEGGGYAAARRAGKFSEGLRITKSLLAKKSRLLVCTNQVRDDLRTGGFGPKEKATGGRAIAFWASLRIRVTPGFPKAKIGVSRSVSGIKMDRVIGVRSTCEVVKSSIDVPYRETDISILFNYGIDEIRDNLTFLKETKGTKDYELNGTRLGGTIDTAIRAIEEGNLTKELRQETIQTWKSTEELFKVDRKPKER